MIDLLRHGVSHGPHDVKLFYGSPSEGNETTRERFDQNRFTVTRQLRYSRDETQLALDDGHRVRPYVRPAGSGMSGFPGWSVAVRGNK